MDPYIGEIKLFAGNFAPLGWARCDGQVLSISENSALFSLIGTTYGGDGVNTFQLPDLRGRAAAHFGASGFNNPGVAAGAESVSLTTSQLPAHTHPVRCSSVGTQVSPVNAYWGAETGGNTASYSSTSNASMSANAVTPAGNSQPHNNMQPFLVMNYIIALEGLFPSQS